MSKNGIEISLDCPFNELMQNDFLLFSRWMEEWAKWHNGLTANCAKMGLYKRAPTLDEQYST
jgi:hypothetical protein